MFAKISAFFGIGLFVSLSIKGQDETVALKIGGREITRLELAEAYKGYVSTEKDKRKTVDAFVRRFIMVKRKAQAATAAKLDTTATVRTILDIQKSNLLRPLYLTEKEKDSVALKVYSATKEEFAGRALLKVATIFRYLPQNATPDRARREQRLTDSLYNVLLKGGDFLRLARQYSTPGVQPYESYVLSWLATGKTWTDYESQAYTLKTGEYTRPFLSVRGYYIVKLLEERPFPTFESVKPQLIRYMDANGITSQLIQRKLENEYHNSSLEIPFSRWRQQVELALWKKNPAAYRQYILYADAVLAAAWDKMKQDISKADLEQLYPATVNERVVRTLEKDY